MREAVQQIISLLAGMAVTYTLRSQLFLGNDWLSWLLTFVILAGVAGAIEGALNGPLRLAEGFDVAFGEVRSNIEQLKDLMMDIQRSIERLERAQR